METVKNKVYIKEKNGRRVWPKEWYYVKDINSSKEMIYGSTTLVCPDNAETYLDRYYGENWKYVAKT